MTPIKCMLCNKSDHIASTCPDLHDPLKEGFYSGAVQDQHNHCLLYTSDAADE